MSLISVLKSLNGAHFLNATFVAAASGCFFQGGLASAAARVLVTPIFPVAKIYGLEQSQRLDSIDFVKNFIGL